ncbi:hypothetical protein BCR44DRAFT_119663 [Catenaria anguillulae PL171]|uniref:FAD-binding domain-containing protein n=1 Tax=Catenaria anguillulae PL171 TaxID=765915 RepID=A0A1Y2HB25_9FUNG|nr:hypothetical protein BCR44DRAFT_119663 [Catenaria anguillulae PL171]
MRVNSDGELDTSAPDEANLYDVLIVGGGPTGLYLGNQLHHYLSGVLGQCSPDAKIKILIVEKSASLSVLSKALAIHSRSLETLANLGPDANVPHALRTQAHGPSTGVIVQAAHIRDKTSVLAEFHPPSPAEIQSPYPAMLLRPQFDTEHLLARELLRRANLASPAVDLQLQCSTQVVAIDTNDAYLRCPATIHARYVIGCDGGRSPVRHMCHIDFPGTTRLEVMWMCDVRIVTSDGRPVSFTPLGGPGAISVMIGSNHGLMVVFTMEQHKADSTAAPMHRIGFLGADDQVASMFGSVDAAMEAGVADAGTGYIDKITGGSGAASAPTQTPKLDVLEALFNARFKSPWADVLADPATVRDGDDTRTGFKFVDPAWRTRFKLNERVAAAYVAHDRDGHPRIMLAGDAAHVHTPIGGHGMNLGLQDAGNLAFKLAAVLSGRAKSAKRAIDSYVEERKPIAEQVVQMTSANASFATSHLALMRASERMVKATGGIRLQYPAGHRAPMRAALVPHPLREIAIQVTPLDLYVDAGNSLSWTVLVLAPIHSLATVVFALPAEWTHDDEPARRSWAVVHRIALRASPPEQPHPLDAPQVLVVPGVQRKVTNTGAVNGWPRYEEQVVEQRAVPDKCRQWMDSDGSVARFLFGATHHADFGCKKEGEAWIVVVRPDGYMGMCGFGVTGEQVGEYLSMCRGE